MRAIIALANALGLRTIAEGVEREAQAEFLQRLGCSLGQGYALGRPVPWEELSMSTATAAALAASVESR